MKKISSLFVVMFCVLSPVCAQDTIFFKDGSTALVNLVSMNDDTVWYKSWTNLKGPTWVKKQSNIARIVRTRRMPITDTENLDFGNCRNSNGQKKSRISKALTGNSIVRHIDSLYFQNTADAAEPKIKNYVNNLPSCINRKKMREYYVERYKTSCKSNIAEDIIRDGETFLCLGIEDENAPEIYSVVTKLYARQNDEKRCNYWIEKFDNFSKENDNLYSDDIEKLKEFTHELLHPTSPKDLYRGYWVLLEDNYDWLPIILRIDDLADEDDNAIPDCATLILPNSSMEWILDGASTYTYVYDTEGRRKAVSTNREEGHSYLPDKEINISQGVDYRRESLYIRFGSEKLVDFTKFAPVAHAMIDAFQDESAKLIQIINTEDLPVEKRIGYSAAVTGISSLLIGSVTLIASIVEKSFDQYGFTLGKPNKKGVMLGNVSHFAMKMTNEYQNITDNSNKNGLFVKWENDDNVVFASGNKGRKRPITCAPIYDDEDPQLAEFNKIKKEHTFWQLQYAIPEFVGTAAGIGMFAGGITCVKRNKVSAGVPLILTGIVGSCASIIVPLVVSNHRRNKAFENMNRRNYNKLRVKAGLGDKIEESHDVGLKISPCYFPEQGYGLALGLRF